MNSPRLSQIRDVFSGLVSPKDKRNSLELFSVFCPKKKQTEPFPDFDPLYGQVPLTIVRDFAYEVKIETSPEFDDNPRANSNTASSQVSPTAIAGMNSSASEDSFPFPTALVSDKDASESRIEAQEHNMAVARETYTTPPGSDNDNHTQYRSLTAISSSVASYASGSGSGESIHIPESALGSTASLPDASYASGTGVSIHTPEITHGFTASLPVASYVSGSGKSIHTPENAHGPTASLPVDTSKPPLYPPREDIGGVDGGNDIFKALIDPVIPTFASPAPTTRSVSTAESTVSKHPYLDGDPRDRCWNNENLRDLTDIVRECVESRVSIPPARAAELSVVLTTLTQDELAMTIYDVVDSHMDKLLECMIKHADSIEDPYTASLMKKCKRLSAIWEKIFLGKWASIDSIRLKDMLGGTVKDLISADQKTVIGEEQRGEMLRGMSMTVNAEGTIPVFKTPITTLAAANSQTSGATTFAPGRWWPNKAAAARDGIITARHTNVTLNPLYGPTALVLLRGEEIQGPELNMTQYSVVETKEETEMLDFLTRRGPFRLLRGCKLKSLYAPKAGLRYDGLYERYQFGLKTDEVEKCNRYTIILKRVDSQPPMATILLIPRPHQLDNFRIYNQWIAREMQAQAGQVKYAVWRISEEEQQREKEAWEERMASPRFRTYSIVPRRASYRQE